MPLVSRLSPRQEEEEETTPLAVAYETQQQQEGQVVLAFRAVMLTKTVGSQRQAQGHP